MENETQKPDLDTYPGLVSDLFSNVFSSITNLLSSKNIIITPEFTFFFALLAYIIFSGTFSLNTTIFGILSLVILNLFWPNIPQIKNRFFSTQEEKLDRILGIESEQEALSKLNSFLSGDSRFSLKITRKIFSEKFSDNYDAYEIYLKKIGGMDDYDVKFFLEKKLLNKIFFNEVLMKMFIDKSPASLSHQTYLKLKQTIKAKNFTNKITKLFNYKYCRYGGVDQSSIVWIHERDGIYNTLKKIFIVTIGGIILTAYAVGFLFAINYQNTQAQDKALVNAQLTQNFNNLGMIFVLSTIIFVIIFILNYVIRHLAMHYVVRETFDP